MSANDIALGYSILDGRKSDVPITTGTEAYAKMQPQIKRSAEDLVWRLIPAISKTE
jgi:hypothetical protein